MRLIDITRALVTEGIQIKDFKKLHNGVAFEEACDNFEARVQGDDEAREKFGLKDLNALKNDPDEFVERVWRAVKFIEKRSSQRRERKNQSKLMRSLEELPDGVNLVYKNKNYAIVSPDDPCYSALAGHLDGATAPWCIAVNDGLSMKYLKRYSAVGTFYFYDLRHDNSWAMVVDAVAYSEMLDEWRVSYREFEDRNNDLTGADGGQRNAFLQMLSDIGEESEEGLNERLVEYIGDHMNEDAEEALKNQIETEIEYFGDYEGLYRASRVKDACDELRNRNGYLEGSELMVRAAKAMAEDDEADYILPETLEALYRAGAEWSCKIARPFIQLPWDELASNMLKMALEYGADDLDEVDDKTGNTILMDSILAGNNTLVSLILEKDPDQVDDVENENGQTALDLARACQSKEVREAFIKAGWEL